MKKVIVAGVVAAMLSVSGPALGHDTSVNDQYDDDITHPIRLAYYLVHPIGFTAEWLIARPFQHIISREQLRNVFGWRPMNEDGTYHSTNNM